MTCCIVFKRISLPLLIITFICPVFFLSNEIFCHIFIGSCESQSLNLVYTLRKAKYIMGKKTKMLRLSLPSFSIFIFSISHSNVIHREI